MDIAYYLSCENVNTQSHWTEYDSGCNVLPMKTLADRLNERMDELGMTQDRLAELAKVSQTTIHKLCTGKAKESRKLVAIANVLGTNSEWLQSGKEGWQANTEPGPAITGVVPLISWVQAGAFCNVVDLFQPGDAEDWLPTIQKLGPRSYALRVKGDSMTAPYGRSYPEGCIIYVDPDTAVTNGARVIAKLPDSEEATFKMYVEDAGKRFLKPLNPQYPILELTSDMLICGVVRGYFMPE